jgi:hypothetical protein
VSKIEVWAAIRPQILDGPVILFLDYDGVLHPDPCRDAAQLFEHAPRLVHALGNFPQVAVVLSTAWRQGRSYERLLAPLPAALQERTIGVTPNFSDFTSAAALIPYRRQAECLRWMHQNRLEDEPWLALDDRPCGFTPYCENLIGCHPQSGFDVAISARLRSTLQRHFEGRAQTVDLLIG